MGGLAHFGLGMVEFENDFHLNENSPAIDAGIGPSDIDINGNPRNSPDLGAYEFE